MTTIKNSNGPWASHNRTLNMIVYETSRYRGQELQGNRNQNTSMLNLFSVSICQCCHRVRLNGDKDGTEQERTETWLIGVNCRALQQMRPRFLDSRFQVWSGALLWAQSMAGTMVIKSKVLLLLICLRHLNEIHQLLRSHFRKYTIFPLSFWPNCWLKLSHSHNDMTYICFSLYLQAI